MVALDAVTVDEVEALVRRAAPFAGLPRSALEAVLDMLAGRYPSDAFAELRPRLVWDRVTGELTARRGAQRLAVTSGGTIPDRGLFGVFLAGARGPGPPGRRARRGDGLRVAGRRRVPARLVVLAHRGHHPRPGAGHAGARARPAGCRSGRATRPAGRSSSAGRSARSCARSASATPEPARGPRPRGRAGRVGHRQPARLPAPSSARPPTTCPTTARSWSSGSATSSATGGWSCTRRSARRSTRRGRWRSPPGCASGYGLEVPSMHSDDGIVLRLPDTDAEPPAAEIAVFEPDEIEALVTAEVGGSALFASRFRECAARALLLPRRDPRRRTPLWQQRQRANQLLQVASEYGDFPVVLEAMRECLQDVFDVPGPGRADARPRPRARCGSSRSRRRRASPFARSLLFGYVGMFLYEGDAPLAERRAQALSLDSALLAELLGADRAARAARPRRDRRRSRPRSQRLAPDRHARGVDGVADLLRVVGDLTTDEAHRARRDRRRTSPTLEERPARDPGAHRRRGALAGDRGRRPGARRARRGAAGRRARGVHRAGARPARRPGRRATPAPTARSSPQRRRRPARARASPWWPPRWPGSARAGRVVQGEFRPGGVGHRVVRRRGAARDPPPLAGRAAQGGRAGAGRGAGPLPAGLAGRRRRGAARRRRRCCARSSSWPASPLPASALETLVLPSRVADYSPALLDELTARRRGRLGRRRRAARQRRLGRASPRPTSPPLRPARRRTTVDDPLARRGAATRSAGDEALFFRALADRARRRPDDRRRGRPRGLGPGLGRPADQRHPRPAARPARLGGAHRARPQAAARRAARYGRYAGLGRARRRGARSRARRRPAWPGAGRRSRRATPTRPAARSPPPRCCSTATAWSPAARSAAERVTGGFAAVYPVLKAAEEPAGPGAATSSRASARRSSRCPARSTGCGREARPLDARAERRRPALVLAATDPANPYGAALPWPDGAPARPTAAAATSRPARPARWWCWSTARCVLYVERGGRTLLSFTDDAAVAAAGRRRAGPRRPRRRARQAAGRAGRRRAVVASALGDALEAAGFRPDPARPAAARLTAGRCPRATPSG